MDTPIMSIWGYVKTSDDIRYTELIVHILWSITMSDLRTHTST
jgi:hypothetical protein